MQIYWKKRGGILNAIGGPWVLCMDGNGTPADLVSTGWLTLVNGVAHAPTAPTCNDSVYDFFVTSKCAAHAVRKVATIAVAEFSSHSPTRLWQDARPRADHFRVLRPIGKLEAVLPAGPQSNAFYHKDDQASTQLEWGRSADLSVRGVGPHHYNRQQPQRQQ